MRFAKVLSLVAALVVPSALPAAAQSIVAEGFTTVNRFSVSGVALEYRLSPFHTAGKTAYSAVVRGMYDTGENSWIGAGLHIRHDLRNGWFVEGATMPGRYSASDARYDLGKDLEFFSYLGVGHDIGQKAFVSVMFGHMSNANLGNANPGRNSVSFRIGSRF